MPANEEVDLQPDPSEVLQEELTGHEAAIPVVLLAPARVHLLPNHSGATRQIVVTAAQAGQPIKLLAADHRRARVTLVSTLNTMNVALSAGAAQDVSRMAAWPVNVPLIILTDTEVYVSGVAASVFSYVAEYWAAGEGPGL